MQSGISPLNATLITECLEVLTREPSLVYEIEQSFTFVVISTLTDEELKAASTELLCIPDTLCIVEVRTTSVSRRRLAPHRGLQANTPVNNYEVAMQRQLVNSTDLSAPTVDSEDLATAGGIGASQVSIPQQPELDSIRIEIELTNEGTASDASDISGEILTAFTPLLDDPGTNATLDSREMFPPSQPPQPQQPPPLAPIEPQPTVPHPLAPSLPAPLDIQARPPSPPPLQPLGLKNALTDAPEDADATNALTQGDSGSMAIIVGMGLGAVVLFGLICLCATRKRWRGLIMHCLGKDRLATRKHGQQPMPISPHGSPQASPERRPLGTSSNAVCSSPRVAPVHDALMRATCTPATSRQIEPVRLPPPLPPIGEQSEPTVEAWAPARPRPVLPPLDTTPGGAALLLSPSGVGPEITATQSSAGAHAYEYAHRAAEASAQAYAQQDLRPQLTNGIPAHREAPVLTPAHREAPVFTSSPVSQLTSNPSHSEITVPVSSANQGPLQQFGSHFGNLAASARLPSVRQAPELHTPMPVLGAAGLTTNYIPGCVSGSTHAHVRAALQGGPGVLYTL